MTVPSLPEVTGGSQDEGFVDLLFRLVRFDTLADGGHRVEARGLHEGKEVGFSAILLASWDAQPLEDTDDKFYWGVVVLRSLGAPSDALVETLDCLYGTRLGSSKMGAEVPCTAVGLANDPRLVAGHPTRTKLFFESDLPEHYGEIFFNIDTQARWVALNEKDQGYRKAIVRALAAPPVSETRES